MAFIEIIGVAILILLIYIAIKLSKKEEVKKEENVLADKLLLQQLQNIEKTLDTKAKEDNERQQKIMKCVEDNIGTFTRTIHGTKRRGKVGEAILKQILSESIASGLVVTELKTDSGSTVEFAWDIKNGKYLPIDSKMPELDELYGRFEQSENPDEQVKLKKDILKIVEKSKNEAKKYLNNHNTIDKCIVAVPDSIFDQFPDINKDSVKTGIFVAGYTKVFLFACVLGENYTKGLALGNIGVYKDAVHSLKNILGEIEKKSDTINKGITQISNANDGIVTEVNKSLNKLNQVAAMEVAEVKRLK